MVIGWNIALWQNRWVGVGRFERPSSARVACALRPVRSIPVAVFLSSRCAERCAKDAFLTSFRATLIKKLNSTERGALFRHFASPRWSPLRTRTRVVSFFIIFSKSFQTKTKKIKALRPKMTKIVKGVLPEKKSGGGQKKYFCQPAIWSSCPHQGHNWCLDGCSWSLSHYQYLSEHTCKHFQLTRRIVRLRRTKSWLFKCAPPCPWCFWRRQSTKVTESSKKREQSKEKELMMCSNRDTSKSINKQEKRSLHTISWSLSE